MKNQMFFNGMNKNMYQSSNLSCRFSNGNSSIDNLLLGVMETDFLNFHDEEHFGTALYQNDLLEDSQSSLLDVVGDNYTRTNSNEYDDHSIIWDQDVERELNGDVAVIPMSGQIDSFPKLSNSPPSKDFQKIFSDWQHLTAIESTPTEDQGLAVDMLDCFTPSNVPVIPPNIENNITNILPNFDFSQTKIPKTETFVKKSATPKVSGGKNMELLKVIVKEEIDSDVTSTFPSADDLEDLNDSFDITSYVNGDDDMLLQNTEIKKNIYNQRFGGCYEKNLPQDENDVTVKEEITLEVKMKQEIIEKMSDDSEEDCTIDVETVSEQMPVLQARDVTSLWEQFEANEVANSQLPQNLFEEKLDVPISTSIPLIKQSNKLKQPTKIKQVNPELKQPTNKICKNIRDSPPIELIQKIKASGTKKPISVIPAMPSKKPRYIKPLTDKDSQVNKNKNLKTNPPNNESFQLDHDYCTVSSISRENKCDNQKVSSDNLNEIKNNLGTTTTTIIDDTAIRIQKQIKNAINNENAIKQKILIYKNQDLLKNQSTIKNADGKVMISLLKNNVRNNITNKMDEQIQQQNTIKFNGGLRQQTISKKRKLNLEEYKKLRGEIIKSNNTNSTNNSPKNEATDQKEKYHELIMKMASEILKTNVKSKQNNQVIKEELVSSSTSNEDKTDIKPIKTIKSEKYKMKTIVSIGVNTDSSYLLDKLLTKSETKIAFKLAKRKEFNKNNFYNVKLNDIDARLPIKKEHKSKISQIITPILQNARPKINSNSLITNITATLLQQSPTKLIQIQKTETKPEHGEDKTVIILNKNDEKPNVKTIGIQTDQELLDQESYTESKIEKPVRQYRRRRNSSASSSKSYKSHKSSSSSNSISSWSRSRSRSRTDSSSRSDYSHSSRYSSDSSRSRSVSPIRRWYSERNPKIRHRYSRSRRRSRSNSYKTNFNRHSRSPYCRSRSRRQRESVERERMKEVEERRVIYVGKIDDDTTKADLRMRFQSFGPITNVSVHFRDHGDNYGFVTFQHKMDAYEAVERGNEDPNQPKYDISFGGRRAFCKTRYSDLDKIEDDPPFSSSSIFRRDEDSFDILLREVQAKLRKRKV